MRNDSWAPGSSPINRIEEGLLALEPVRRHYRMRAILLIPGQITLGSADDCTIPLQAEGVMPHHCLIESSSKRTVLFAENSRTWHNEGPVRETDLQPGDRLAIGPVEFRVRLATADELLTLIPDEFTEPNPPQPTVTQTPFRPQNVKSNETTFDSLARGLHQDHPPESDVSNPYEGIAQCFPETWAMEFHPSSALVTSDATAWDDLADWGRDVKHELDSVNRQREEFQQQAAIRELALQEAAADLEAREQTLTEELRTIREALSREHSSLEMETLLLREQRGRMEVRERDLNAQRREIEDRERRVLQREKSETEERERLELWAAQLEAHRLELADMETQQTACRSDLEAKAREITEQETRLAIQQADLETVRQQFQQEQAESQRHFQAQKTEFAHRELLFQQNQQELAQTAKALDEKQRQAEECLENLNRKHSLLSSLASEQAALQNDLLKERRELSACPEELHKQHGILREQTREIEERRFQVAADQHRLEQDQEVHRLAIEQYLEDQFAFALREADLRSDQAEIAHIREQLHKDREAHAQAQRNMQDRLDHLAASEREAEERHTRLREEEASLSQHRQELKSHEHTIEQRAAELDQALQDLAWQRKDLDDERSKLESREQALEVEKQHLKGAAETLAQDQLQATRELHLLKRREGELQAEAGRLREERDLLDEEFLQLNAARERSEQDFAHIRSEREQLVQNRRELKAEWEQLSDGQGLPAPANEPPRRTQQETPTANAETFQPPTEPRD